MMTDGDQLPDTFEEWLSKAEEAERNAQRAGLTVTRAILDPYEFSIWCRDKGLPPGERSRTEFASWVAAHQGTGYD